MGFRVGCNFNGIQGMMYGDVGEGSKGPSLLVTSFFRAGKALWKSPGSYVDTI